MSEAASSAPPTAMEPAGKLGSTARRIDTVLGVLLFINFLLFVLGWLGHSGVDVPLGFATWDEPRVIPAAIVEGLGALSLSIALGAGLAGHAHGERVARVALWYCFLGVLWGMARLSMGSIPEARTETNDFLHIGMTLLSTLALVRLTALRHDMDVAAYPLGRTR